MNIRVATLEDVNAVAAIHVRTWQEAYRNILPGEYLASLSVEKREAMWREALEENDPELWVAENDSSLMGWVAFGPCRDDTAPVTAGEVWAIYVDPVHWSRGVGRTLWQKARSRLVERGYLSISLWVLKENMRAIRFYLAAGLSPNFSRTKQILLGGNAVTEVRFELHL